MKQLIKPFLAIKKETDESVCISTQKQRLLEDMEITRKAMETAYSNFDNVTDPDLIDCYIYEVNSVMKRYKFLMDQAEKLNLPPDSKITDSLCEKSPVASSLVQVD